MKPSSPSAASPAPSPHLPARDPASSPAAHDPSPLRRTAADESSELDASGVHEVRFLESDLVDRFGDRATAPRRRPGVDVRKLPLDPTSAFVLGFVDGLTTVDALLDIGPPRDALARSLCLLFDHGVIER